MLKRSVKLSLNIAVVIAFSSLSVLADGSWAFAQTGNEHSVMEESDFDGVFEAPRFGHSTPDFEESQLKTDIELTQGVETEQQLFAEEAEAVPLIQFSPNQLTQVATKEWQLLPEGLLYHSYLAGEKEPRFASQWLSDKNRGLVWEAVVGGRWGLFRHGTDGPDGEGFQFDVIGAAFVRIDPEEESDLEAADFNAGFLGTWKYGKWRYKAGYNHYSCHLGDEYLLKNPTVTRYNYVRDSVLIGLMYDITPELQTYGEIAYAPGAEGGAKPLELQFGVQYSPSQPTGLRGAPFVAVNGHLRQEFHFSGSVNAEAGWAWRGGKNTGRLFRVGAQHYNGRSMQWSFVNRYENMTGIGMWFDY